jgi:predicted phage terminase large subunit-like protein
LLARRQARRAFGDYVRYTNLKFRCSAFSDAVCVALDKFLIDVEAGLRPILVLQAPPQHGKSELVSRRLPAFILGKSPNMHLGCASYSDELAHAMAQDVRRNIADTAHQRLFPVDSDATVKYAVNRIGEFNAPGGTGGYIGVGVGAGLTGRPVDIGIIDDPVKNEKEALSPTTKEGHWSWYQSVFTTRLSERSGQIVMATSWAQDDLPGRIIEQFAENPRLTVMRFPAINEPQEVGYNPNLPQGPLVPQLHSLQKLRETKALLSDYWWSALYQQSAKPLGGNVFKEEGIRYYMPKDLPAEFEIVIASWDCTFKDTDGTDYVVGQVWGKKGANSYLLSQKRERMSFTKTVREVKAQKSDDPRIREVLIEDKANGPAVIDTLKNEVPGIIPIDPDGSKLARAHAVTSYWEAGNVWIPHPSIAPWIKAFVGEVTFFPAGANDDQVDAMTQALRRLYGSNNAILKFYAAEVAEKQEKAQNELAKRNDRLMATIYG